MKTLYIISFLIFSISFGYIIYYIIKNLGTKTQKMKLQQREIKNVNLHRYIELKKAFMVYGYNIQTLYNNQMDIILFLSQQNSDDLYVSRILNIYEHLSRELRIPNNTYMNNILEKISNNITEHYKYYLSNDELRLKSTINAIDKLLEII